MIRKGDMHLMMERGKVYGKSLKNRVFHHSWSNNHGGLGLQEYEFSCSNSPAIFHVAKRKHHYFPTHVLHFPCIYPHQAEEKEGHNAIVLPKLDCSNDYFTKDCLDSHDLPAVQKLSPMLSSLSRRILKSSGKEDNEHQVNSQAEEFIVKFYQQLRLQNRMVCYNIKRCLTGVQLNYFDMKILNSRYAKVMSRNENKLSTLVKKITTTPYKQDSKRKEYPRRRITKQV